SAVPRGGPTMAKTISANSGEILLGTTNVSFNPLTVLAGVTVAGFDGIYGASNLHWTITNAGTVTGIISDGIALAGGGVVVNGAGASITGATWGIDVTGTIAATITSMGTISGGTGAVHFGNANGNVLGLYPGALTQGAIVGGTGTDTLDLGV